MEGHFGQNALPKAPPMEVKVATANSFIGG
jgi:hypothetical protein